MYRRNSYLAGMNAVFKLNGNKKLRSLITVWLRVIVMQIVEYATIRY